LFAVKVHVGKQSDMKERLPVTILQDELLICALVLFTLVYAAHPPL